MKVTSDQLGTTGSQQDGPTWHRLNGRGASPLALVTSPRVPAQRSHTSSDSGCLGSPGGCQEAAGALFCQDGLSHSTTVRKSTTRAERGHGEMEGEARQRADCCAFTPRASMCLDRGALNSISSPSLFPRLSPLFHQDLQRQVGVFVSCLQN